MRPMLSLLAAAIVASASAFAGDIPANIQTAIDNPNRSEENLARDESRKPGEVLAFFGIEEGMTVLDLFSGGGYFSEIASGAVGPEGKVIAHLAANQNNLDKEAALTEQYAPFGNIELSYVESGAPLPYEDNSVDVAIFALISHHFHYNEQSGESVPATSTAFYQEVRRVLKPGGVFAIIEHKATDGSSRADSAGWHRIPEAVLKADVTGAGFAFDKGAPDIHNNPKDPMNVTWFGDADDPDSLRGRTTRIVHRYVKPAE